MITIYYNNSGGWCRITKQNVAFDRAHANIVRSINEVMENSYYKDIFSLETLSNYIKKDETLIDLRCFLTELEEKLIANIGGKFSCSISTSTQPIICPNSGPGNNAFKRNYLVKITSNLKNNISSKNLKEYVVNSVINLCIESDVYILLRGESAV